MRVYNLTSLILTVVSLDLASSTRRKQPSGTSTSDSIKDLILYLFKDWRTTAQYVLSLTMITRKRSSPTCKLESNAAQLPASLQSVLKPHALL